jgi:hypothetical protein
MSDTANRNWEELARAARVEQDSDKLMEIVEELNRALDERSKPAKDGTTSSLMPRTLRVLHV